MRPTTSAPRYHPIHNPPYQINYRAKRSGKHITVTKRRITFQFGFSDADAIASGLIEADCRGEEHEVVLIWSHISGKRELFMDGREVHASKAAMGNTKFSHTWGIGSHVLKLVANASTSTDGSRQFDLLLDGMSYFEFTKIYQLGHGLKKSSMEVVRAPSIETVPCSQASSYHEERREEVNAVSPPISELQIDVFGAPFDSCNLLEAELPSPANSGYGYPTNMTRPATTVSSSYDEFSPIHFSSGGQQKSFAAISNEILTAYGNENDTNAPPAQVPVNGYLALPAPPIYPPPHAPVDVNVTVMPAQMNPVAQDSANTNLALVPTYVQPTTSYSLDNQTALHPKPIVSMYDNVQEDAIDDITACMNKLVNFDDVSKPSKSSTTKIQGDKSQSLQSLKWAMANSGRAPTLSEIHAMKSSSTPSSQATNYSYQPQQYPSYTYGRAY